MPHTRRVMPPRDILIGNAALHEAGHALASVDFGLTVHSVSVSPTGHGRTEFSSCDPSTLTTMELTKDRWRQIYGTMAALLAGPAVCGQAISGPDLCMLQDWQTYYTALAARVKTLPPWPEFLRECEELTDAWCKARADTIHWLSLRLAQRRTMLAAEWSQAVAEVDGRTRGASRYRVA